MSKSLPAEVNISTIELHLPVEAKEKLSIYCSVDFDFLALMQFDMTFDDTLHDSSSFGKLTNSCYWYCLSIKANVQQEYLWEYIY